MSQVPHIGNNCRVPDVKKVHGRGKVPRSRGGVRWGGCSRDNRSLPGATGAMANDRKVRNA